MAGVSGKWVSVHEHYITSGAVPSRVMAFDAIIYDDPPGDNSAWPSLTQYRRHRGSNPRRRFLLPENTEVAMRLKDLPPEVIRSLDQEIGQRTPEELQELAQRGARILRQGNDPDKAREKARQYMRRYRAKIALAEQRGLLSTQR